MFKVAAYILSICYAPVKVSPGGTPFQAYDRGPSDHAYRGL